MIYCNSRIVLIDFHVLQTKRYSFFIEEELCEVNIERKDNQFYYDFHVNREVDTPVNRAWRVKLRQNRRKTVILISSFFITLIVFIGIALYLSNRPGKDQRETLLAAHASETIARVFVNERLGDSLAMHYSFAANGQVYENEGHIAAQATTNGMPLESGDEFTVLYADSHAFVNQIDFDKPTTEQIQRYRDRAIQRHLQLHPEITAQRAQCQVEVAYEIKGVGGLADFYFQDLQPNANPQHNQLTYLRLTRDTPFVQKTGERCL